MKAFTDLFLVSIILMQLAVFQSKACTKIVWEGTVSSDWNDPDNYNKGRLPQWNDLYVEVNGNSYTNPPVINSIPTFSHTLLLNNNASFTVNANADLDEVDVQNGVSNSITVSSGSTLSVGGGLFLIAPGGLNVGGDGMLQVAGDFSFETSNGALDNDGNMTVSGDLTTGGGVDANNQVNNKSNATLIINGNISFNGAVNDITNEGILTLGGSFQGINIGGIVENMPGSIWNWSYTGGTWDTNILSVFAENGTFVYNALSDQNIIPLSYKNLIVSGSGTKTLVNDATVINSLTLSGGNLALGDNDLTIAPTANISGGANSNYIINNGAGALIQQNIGLAGRTGGVVFPVGTPTSYTPLVIDNTSGTADDFSVRLIDEIYDNGTAGSPTTNDVVARTWFINEEVAGGSDATLTFQWNASDQLGTFDPSEVHVIHYNGNAWEKLWVGAASGTGPYIASATHVSNFSPFGVEGVSSPLPVELLNFDAIYNGKSVDVSWETASELNNDYFVLERSFKSDGSFKKLTQVEGNGTTNEHQSYIVNDVSPNAGVNFYRLIQVDYNGNSKIYEPTKVEVPLGDNVWTSIYPVPFKGDFLNIQITGYEKDLKTELAIYDITGVLQYREDIFLDKNEGFNKQVSFDKKLTPGVYVLSINTSNPIVRKITVE